MTSIQPNSTETEDSPVAGDVVCRNCNAQAPGQFCPKCGQETATEPPTVAEFLWNFIHRYATREGRLWQTLSKLFFAPGALTIEYIVGRRTRYLRPLQLYLMASVIVFAAVQFFGLNLSLRLAGDYGVHLLRASPLWSAQDKSFASRLSPAQIIIDYVDTPAVRQFKSLSQEDRFRFLRARRAQYVSYFALFLVPLYALILELCYFEYRRRYGEYLIFGLHTHTFLLLVLLIEAALPAIVANALSCWVVTYFIVAMKRVYGGAWAEALGRGIMAGMLYLATYFVGNLLLIFALLEI